MLKMMDSESEEIGRLSKGLGQGFSSGGTQRVGSCRS